MRAARPAVRRGRPITGSGASGGGDSRQEEAATLGADFDDVLAAAAAGGSWAFRRLYDDLAPAVTGYLRLRGAVDPDDLCSETFLGVFRGLPDFRGEESAFRSWVFTIAHRRLLDERRRRSRTPATRPLTGGELDTPGGDVEREALEGLGGRWVHEVLAELSDDQRDVILLRVVGDLSVADTAAALGKRPGAIRALQHRAIGALRRTLATRDERSAVRRRA